MCKSQDVFKNKRFIGLVLLTIIVIIGIVLTVFFVNQNSKITSLGIKKQGEDSKCFFEVTNIKTTNNINDETNKVESVELLVYVTIKAKKNLSLKSEDFLVNGKQAISIEGLKDIKKGQQIDIILKYEIKDNSLLYLTFNKFKVALASVM